MEDQIIMNAILTMSKNMADILMHASLESRDAKINKTFKDSLTKYIELQQELYLVMEEKGYYKVENAPKTKIDKALTKYAQN